MVPVLYLNCSQCELDVKLKINVTNTDVMLKPNCGEHSQWKIMHTIRTEVKTVW